MKISTDQSAQTDTLDRKRFAQEIGSNLVNHFKSSHESLVLGIHGPWGSGKSTLLGFIKDAIVAEQALANTPRVLVMDFNPWMFSGKEQLHRSFLTELAAKIESKSYAIR